jgi:uncharacterized protein (TIGR02453 family)
MSEQPAFTPALFGFLRDLRKNNDREWFHAHKEDYERDVKEPALAFVAAFAPTLRKISPHLIADERPVGGSLFRLHRDVRFGPDKRPYKTEVGIQFRHVRDDDVHAPSFYLHLAPGDVFAGAGVWRPGGAALAELRDAIVASPAAWRRASAGSAFAARWALRAEFLQRMPRGYDPDHPYADDLRRKDFLAITGFSERAACGPAFPEQLADAWRASAPLMRFLTRALGLPW